MKLKLSIGLLGGLFVAGCVGADSSAPGGTGGQRAPGTGGGNASGGSPGSGGSGSGGSGSGSGGSASSGGQTGSSGGAGTGGSTGGAPGSGGAAGGNGGGFAGAGGGSGGGAGRGTGGAGGVGGLATGGGGGRGGATTGGAAGATSAGGAGGEAAKTLTQLQNDFMTMKLGMFLHFNMGTFTGEEWATPHGDPKRFNPTGLDADQWATAAAAAGVKYVVLTTKHHDGFCLWNSTYTTYDVGSSPWKNGQGDVVREYVDAMRAHGLKVGFYFSIWDRTNGNTRGVPTMDFVKGQLRELLTSYGPITLLWFDGWGWLNSSDGITFSDLAFQPIRDYIRTLQPNVLVLNNDHRHSFTTTDIFGYERNVEGTPPANNTSAAEVADNIRSDGKWFYSTGACNLKSLATLTSSLSAVNNTHANYLLDLTPDQTGHIPDCQVQLLSMLKR